MRPTFAQEEYARALVEILERENQWDAPAWARKLLKVQTRQEISNFINAIKERTDSLKENF